MNSEAYQLPELGDLGASPSEATITVGVLEVWTGSFQGEAQDDFSCHEPGELVGDVPRSSFRLLGGSSLFPHSDLLEARTSGSSWKSMQ